MYKSIFDKITVKNLERYLKNGLTTHITGTGMIMAIYGYPNDVLYLVKFNEKEAGSWYIWHKELIENNNSI